MREPTTRGYYWVCWHPGVTNFDPTLSRKPFVVEYLPDIDPIQPVRLFGDVSAYTIAPFIWLGVIEPTGDVLAHAPLTREGATHARSLDRNRS